MNTATEQQPNYYGVSSNEPPPTTSFNQPSPYLQSSQNFQPTDKLQTFPPANSYQSQNAKPVADKPYRQISENEDEKLAKTQVRQLGGGFHPADYNQPSNTDSRQMQPDPLNDNRSSRYGNGPSQGPSRSGHPSMYGGNPPKHPRDDRRSAYGDVPPPGTSRNDRRSAYGDMPPPGHSRNDRRSAYDDMPPPGASRTDRRSAYDMPPADASKGSRPHSSQRYSDSKGGYYPESDYKPAKRPVDDYPPRSHRESTSRTGTVPPAPRDRREIRGPYGPQDIY